MSERARILAKILEAKKEKKVLQARRNNQSMSSPIDRIMFLQRTIGNQAVQRLFSSGSLLPKTGKCARRWNELPKLQNGSDNFQYAAVKSNEPLQGYHHSQIRKSHQNTSENEGTDKYSSDGLLASLVGSGTCQNGGGSSVCDPTIGKYKVTGNSNTCCTKSCTQAHEERHVTDHDGYGCCAALAVAWGKSGANKSELVRKYNTWFAQANLVSECNAYSNDVRCADALAITHDCAGKGNGTDCCKDVADYRSTYSAEKTTYCARAPKSVPACPTF
jgi:hypothetical protein